ncbi:putative carboxylesterase 18 [Camellia lanceoleosa]|uniref:Carboxylesterase 18 n=1 Tax=Camellia lanceoleosa TaxID=1840588 RepID=A0ACC0I4Y2_9ERIC|nr:putative carboxylesterase 18 [Camellia lanceoleosa]
MLTINKEIKNKKPLSIHLRECHRLALQLRRRRSILRRQSLIVYTPQRVELNHHVSIPLATSGSLFVPTNPDQTLHVIIFFHSGRFVYLTTDSKAYDAVCRRFAHKVPTIVVYVNYCLALEHRYPAQYDNGFHVLTFLDNNKSQVLQENADLSHYFLTSDNAGSNLAHHVAYRAAESNF